MNREAQAAHRKHAQTLALISFFVLGGILYWLTTLAEHVHNKNWRDVLEFVLYAACFFAVFTIGPMTEFFYGRITRK
ncbi:hypothetical protein [Pseudomonas sp. 910_21]|uniref:hypothetical protein n=1 Tax=Pseudomonas sp. 910_21 TaxID=2604460 RepID=UPI004063E0CC